MSRYLVERIEATPNIELFTETELVDVGGDPEGHLARLTWNCRQNGGHETEAIRHLFLFIGADPETGWTTTCDLALDRARVRPDRAGGAGRGRAASARVEPAGGVRDRRRALGIGQAGRGCDRRGRVGRGGDPCRAGRGGCVRTLAFDPGRGFKRLLRVLAKPVRTARGRRGVVLQPYRGYGSRERDLPDRPGLPAAYRRQHRGGRSSARSCGGIARRPVRGARVRRGFGGAEHGSTPTATAISASTCTRAACPARPAPGTGWTSSLRRADPGRGAAGCSSRPPTAAAWWSATSTTR